MSLATVNPEQLARAAGVAAAARFRAAGEFLTACTAPGANPEQLARLARVEQLRALERWLWSGSLVP